MTISPSALRYPTNIGAVAVIGLPDPERGGQVCAVVEPRQPGVALSFDEMRNFFDDA